MSMASTHLFQFEFCLNIMKMEYYCKKRTRELTLFQYDSTFCVCTPVVELTNWTEWFTVWWAATLGKLATWPYAAHWSECTMLPLATCVLIIGSNVAASRCATISI